MTVKELKKLLAQIKDDTIVFIDYCCNDSYYNYCDSDFFIEYDKKDNRIYLTVENIY